MAWLTSYKHPLPVCITTPNLVVLGLTVAYTHKKRRTRKIGDRQGNAAFGGNGPV